MPARLLPGRTCLCMGLLGFFALLFSVAIETPRAAAAVPRVLASSRQEVRFSIELADPGWREVRQQVGGPPSWEADFTGFSSQGIPGRSRVPRAGGWLVVPPGTMPNLEVVTEAWQPLAEVRPLAIEPVPLMLDDPELGGYREHGLIPRPDQDLPRDRIPAAVLMDMQRPDPALLPGAAVRLGEPVWWRGRRIVAYTLLPLRVDGEGQAVAALRGGQWRVRFVPDPGAGKNAPKAALRRTSGKNDERFAGGFLNGDLLSRLATEGAYLEPAPGEFRRPAAKGATLGYPEVRIPVRRTELLRVGASELLAAGLLPQAPVSVDQLRLYQRRYLPQLDDPSGGEAPPYLEIEVPIHVVSDAELFDAGSFFLFWGLRPRDDTAFTFASDGEVYAVPDAGDLLEINNENNIYWLQLADPHPDTGWARMVQASLPPAAGTPEASYRRTDYYNEAVVYRGSLPSITLDRYYYNRASDFQAVVNLFFWSAVAGQSGAVLQAGIANESTLLRTYRLDLVSGDDLLATLPLFQSSSRDVLTYTASLPPAVMTGPGQSFSLRMRFDGPQSVRGFLDWIKIDYDALYVAPAGRLLFPGGDGQQTSDLQIAGFSAADIGLVEVTDPRNPAFVVLDASNVAADGDDFQLSLRVDQGNGQRRFYAAVRMTDNGVPHIRYSDAGLAVDPAVPTRLDEAGADVLVVVHPQFRTAAQDWVEYRRGRAGPGGLTFKIVQPQELYDWYSGGLRNPWAIKRFVDHALADPSWGSWALVLIGSANENPRELGVLSSGRQWSRDWVPTHVHVQDAGSALAPEVLASDKWFASQAAGGANYPDNAGQPTDLYVGRLPVHSPAELQRILTKIQQVESKAPDQQWRRRSIFMADDAYGTGALGGGGSSWRNMGETAFRISQTYLDGVWQDDPGQVALQTELVLLEPFMAGLYPEADASSDGISLVVARNWCRDSGAPESLRAALGRGGTLAHFQGHANHWLLTHEIWFEDDRRTTSGRRDIDQLTNHGKPWLFCGMGCHLGDFIQNVAEANVSIEPGLGEKMLLWTDAGAVAVYASSGYEYLSSNRNLSETFIRRMVQRPPHATVQGESVASRWMLGELMWFSEADLLAQANTLQNRRMVAQYLVLGDPLLMLDAGMPQVDATLVGDGGGPLPDLQADLVAIDATNRRTVDLRARDEAGIDRLLVLDSAGGDLTASAIVEETPFYDNGSRQIMDYVLSLPVRPFAHDMFVRVYDSASPRDSDAHVQLVLRVNHEAEAVLTQTGEQIDPATFSFVAGQPVAVTTIVASAAWLRETTSVEVAGENLQVSGVSWAVGGDRTLRIFCTVVVPEDASKTRVDRGLNVTIDGYQSYVPLESSATPGGEALISGLVSFPNPMRDVTHFVFATGLSSGRGEVRVWTVSGREVASVPFTLSGGGQERVPWDGRDRRGDRLANGTYLYRAELAGSAGQGRSGMQRLVIMR